MWVKPMRGGEITSGKKTYSPIILTGWHIIIYYRKNWGDGAAKLVLIMAVQV